MAEEVEEIVLNNDRFFPNIIYEEYEYNDNFEKNENSLPQESKKKVRI